MGINEILQIRKPKCEKYNLIVFLDRFNETSKFYYYKVSSRWKQNATLILLFRSKRRKNYICKSQDLRKLHKHIPMLYRFT